MLLSAIFVVTLLSATGTDIIFTTPANVHHYIRLTQYGYVYQPKTDCLAHFTFQVKACHDVHVGLFNEDGEVPFDYEIAIGGWGNTKSRILHKSMSTYIEHFEHNVVDCNYYRSFWVSWRNNVIAVGRSEVFNNDVLMTLNDQAPSQVRYIGISTGYGSSGQWNIPNKQPSLHCFQRSGWKLTPGRLDTSMTLNITWSVIAGNLGQCALTCLRSSSCMSFVHNNDKKTCHGHGQIFSDIAEGHGHKDVGSHYYIKS